MAATRIASLASALSTRKVASMASSVGARTTGSVIAPINLIKLHPSKKRAPRPFTTASETTSEGFLSKYFKPPARQMTRGEHAVVQVAKGAAWAFAAAASMTCPILSHWFPYDKRTRERLASMTPEERERFWDREYDPNITLGRQ